MLRNRLMTILGLIVVASMLLAACGSPTPTEAPAPAATEVPPTEAPTAAPVPVRNGAWVDSIVFSSIDSQDAAVTQLQADQIDVYAETVSSPALFKTVSEDANLGYASAFGSYTELTFNPVPAFADGRLNPFGYAKIREAVNWLVDRNYIVQEIYGGLATTKLFPLNSQFPDYARYVDTARALEAKYAFNADKAKEVITAEMEAAGATLVDGKWQFNGQPVTIIFIIRTEDERKPIGDYVATQLESVGFTVDRQYKTRSEASPIWNRSDPAEGQWSVYTGGWITTAVSRDDATNFAFFYTSRGSGSPLWQAYTPTADFDQVSEALWVNDFQTLDERGELFRKAMDLSIQDSVRVWLVDQTSFSPRKANLQVAYDLAGGIAGSRLWPYTIRFSGQEGGEVRVAMSGILTDPWNPIAGSNWISDSMAYRATSDVGVMPDPYTGLVWPQRIESAQLVAKEGLPISKSLDWIDLQFAPEITIPDDAWVDWDPIAQKFLTVADAKAAAENYGKVDAKATELAGAVDPAAIDAAVLTQAATDLGAFLTETTGVAVDVAAALGTDDAKAALEGKVAEIAALASDDEKKAAVAAYAMEVVGGLDTGTTFGLGTRDYSSTLTKSTVVYEADLFDKVTWHDGSPFTVADFVMFMIMNFDPGKPGSAIYDEAQASTLDSYLSHFKGVRITSTSPLTIETYDDLYLLDAEASITTWFPVYTYGPGAWHNLALGVQAESETKLAFSADKAEANQVEWMSYIAGPSLEILKGYLDANAADGYIPFAPTLGTYVTADEAKARYANLQTFYGAQGHFWLGTGPFFLDKVFPVESTLTLKRFESYADAADKWDRFGEPKIATVDVTAGAVQIGAEATFEVLVTFKDQPYPAAEIAGVKYLVFDPAGNLVASGEAQGVADGQYSVVLSADVTKGFESGAYKLEVAVSSNVVSIPTFASAEFVPAP